MVQNSSILNSFKAHQNKPNEIFFSESLPSPLKKNIRNYFSKLDQNQISLSNLPLKLAQKFNLKRVRIERISDINLNKLALSLDVFIPRAKILNKKLWISSNGKIYKGHNHTSKLPIFFLSNPLKTKTWLDNHTLILNTKEQKIISDLNNLLIAFNEKKIRILSIQYQLHRGFQVHTWSGIQILLGNAPFKKSLEKYINIKSREDFPIEQLKAVELDYPNKALITFKPKI